VRMDLQPSKPRSERNQGFGANLTGSWSDAVNGNNGIASHFVLLITH
jgi:hypothetical protein